MDRPPALPPGAARRRLAAGRRDVLVREEPLLLEVAGRRLLTLRTPGHDEDLARGFLLSEGLIEEPGEIARLEFVPGRPRSESPDGRFVPDRLQVQLRRPPPAERLARFRRVQEAHAGCGLCGLEELAGLPALDDLLEPGRPKVPRATILATLERFRARQGLFATTGGCHGAALCTAGGRVLGFGEDVGRHNALDKAIGQAALAGGPPAFALLSGRAGYELVAKCLRRRVPILVSVSAASALSFDLCREAGATLVGFARGGRLKVYWDEERLVETGA